MPDNVDDTALRRLDGRLAVTIPGTKELPPTPEVLLDLGRAEAAYTAAQIVENTARANLANAQRRCAEASQALQMAQKRYDAANLRDRRVKIDPAGEVRIAG